jgi:peptide/nickel transport system substrate-binding protein
MRRPRRGRFILPLILLLVLPPVFPDAAPAQRNDTVVIGMAQEPDTLIEDFSPMGATRAVLNSLFVWMVEREPQGHLVPRLIEKIPTVKDGDWEILPGKKMRVTYRFKRDYTWHDGRPVTALDALWTYLMLRNPRTPTYTRFILKKIDNMFVPDVNDPYTLVVQWNEPYPFANIGHTIYPRHVLEREYLADPSRLHAHRQARAPVGNGPYRFVEWVPGSHITLEAYDRFPEGKPKIRRQVWRFILDSSVLQANVLAGRVDVTVINNFSIDQTVEIERRAPHTTAHFLPGFAWEQIRVNMDNEWLRDKRVRQALIHAINREEISRRLFHGKQPVAHTWLPPGLEGHNPKVRQYSYDPARARDLLTEAGFTPGPDGILRDRSGKRFELVIMTTAGYAIREQVQLIMREHLKAVGIDLKIDNRPAGVLFGPVYRRRQFPHLIMFATGWRLESLGYGEWHSSQIPTPANNFEGGNISGWQHQDNDSVMDQIVRELDAIRRIQLLKRQQEIWVEELPAIPLWFLVSPTTSKKTLKNVAPDIYGGILWKPDRWEWAE